MNTSLFAARPESNFGGTSSGESLKSSPKKRGTRGSSSLRGILLPVLVGIALSSPAADWPNFRGPNHDGVSTEKIRTNWEQDPPRVVWRVSLDPGLGSLAIQGGRVFTLVRRSVGGQDREFCVALDAATGNELWAYNIGTASYPEGGVGDDDGPRSTPTVQGNRVFVLSSYLRLSCLDAATGSQIWEHDLPSEYQASVIAWQNSASPLVENNRVLVNGNGRSGEHFLAFNTSDGSLAWKVGSDRMTHATPAAVTIGGIRQVIFLAQTGLVSINSTNGTVLWRYPVGYNGTSSASSPVVGSNFVFTSRAYPSQAGAVVVRVANGSAAASLQWSKPNQLMNHWSTPVQVNGYLFGMFGQDSLSFRCVELATGRETWPSPVNGFGYGSTIAVDGRVLASSADGLLALVDPNPNSYSEVARFQALDGKTWNMPAISDGRIYFRSTTEAVSLDVSPPRPPKLFFSFDRASGKFRLRIRNDDGSSLSATRAGQIEILATTQFPPGTNSWSRVSSGISYANGELILEETRSPAQPQRFYRAQAQP